MTFFLNLNSCVLSRSVINPMVAYLSSPAYKSSFLVRALSSTRCFYKGEKLRWVVFSVQSSDVFQFDLGRSHVPHSSTNRKKKLNNLKINVGWRLSMKARGWKCRRRIFLFVVQNITTVNPYKTCSQARVEMVEHGNRDQMTLQN